MIKTEFPYVPDMADCKMVKETKGATCYIMDTCCRSMTKADKLKADREIVQIYLDHAMRKNQGTDHSTPADKRDARGA
jgi:hypothetical protein